MRSYEIIVARDLDNGIGYKNDIPWNLKGDMKRFRNLTSETENCKIGCVIMGRSTFYSIGEEHRPLKNRLNIVISSTMEDYKGANMVVVRSLEEALEITCSENYRDTISKVFIIGGSSIYSQALKKYENLCSKIHITEVCGKYECDRFFVPSLPSNFSITSESELKNEYYGDKIFYYKFFTYENLLREENQYIRLARELRVKGNDKKERTGVGTYSLFGKTMRFDLRDGIFPLLTTKRIFWRGIVEELLWFISGSTDSKILREKKIKIWDYHGSKEFMNSIGLKDREEGDLGPVYGFQWRHFGAKYKGLKHDYTGEGVDQLKNIIDKIKNNPNDRRILMSAWNPVDLNEMVLPPCHVLCQFYVNGDEVSCSLYQRSCDLGLGVPFNIASYSLLLRLICHVCDKKPGEFIYFMGDVHIYKNHVDKLKEQLDRDPRQFPTLTIDTTNKDIDLFKFEDIKLFDYNPHPKISMDLSG